MDPREELQALRRMAELEAKAGGAPKAEKPGLLRQFATDVADTGAGLVRGAGSIGATILAPIDAAARGLNNGKPVQIGGYDIAGHDRRAGMDDALRSMGNNPYSWAFGGGKLTSEIAGTLGAGNVLALGAKGVGAAPAVVRSLQTSGMTTGGAAPVGAAAVAKNLLGRGAAGGAVGGASTALINPDDAVVGAGIGAALPAALRGAGSVGRGVGSAIRGPAQSADVAQAVQQARSAGYVIPPTQARPSLGNRLLEGFSGKITTAQNASAANQGITNRLAAESLGLPGDTKLTSDTLSMVRKSAGQAYENLRGAGMVKADQTYDKALDAIVKKYQGASGGFPGLAKPEVESLVTTLRQPIFNADSAVDALSVLRDKADLAYRSGDAGMGRAAREAATAIEDQIERHLSATAQNHSLLADFRAARQLYAKTYSVEKSLNQTTGSVDARKLAAQLAKGKPLSAELKSAAEFAARFPKAAQAIEGMGSLPQSSPLDWALGGALAAATTNPLALASVAARPAARALTLSPMVQNRLIQRPQPANALGGPAAQSLLSDLGYRTAPVLGAQYLATGR